MQDDEQKINPELRSREHPPPEWKAMMQNWSCAQVIFARMKKLGYDCKYHCEET